MRNRNTWEKRFIVRIGASNCGDQELLPSSRGKVETQESGCCNSDWLWRPKNQGCHCAVRAVQRLKVRSSHIHGQEKVDVLLELNSPFVYVFVLSRSSESWVLLTQQMRGYLILILITSRKKTTLKIQPAIFDYLGISNQTYQHIELTITDPHCGLLQKCLPAGF